jgi:hypothetical protein
MILLDAALPRSGGTEDRSPTHYGPELAKEAERRPAGGSLRRGPGASSPSHSGSINPSSRFMNCPMGALTPIRRLARLRFVQIRSPPGADRAALSSASLVSKCIDAGVPGWLVARCEESSVVVA